MRAVRVTTNNFRNYVCTRLRCRVIVVSSYIMKTILIAAQKGGSGKTTLGRNLSVAATQDGRNVLCLDLDPQGSLRGWWESREAEAPFMLDRDPLPGELKASLNAAQKQFDLCIIDTSSRRLGMAFRSACGR